MGKLRAKLRHPGVQGFGPAFYYTALEFGASTLLQADIDFLIRLIQANESGVG